MSACMDCGGAECICRLSSKCERANRECVLLSQENVSLKKTVKRLEKIIDRLLWKK